MSIESIRSDEQIEVVTGVNHQRENIISVILKRSYNISADGKLKKETFSPELIKADVYYDQGDPMWSSVETENELLPAKWGVDVVVTGAAYAPAGSKVQQMEASVTVGSRTRRIAIFGDRHCIYREGQLPLFSDAIPFERMPIRYERAYGGVDETSNPEIPFYYPRNPIGNGVVIANKRDSLDELMLPNIENPDDLLSPQNIIIEDPEAWPKQPRPQGFGWYGKGWYPRAALLGAYPAFLTASSVTPEEDAGLLPRGHMSLALQQKLPPYVARFNNGASPDLVFSSVDVGTKIQISGMTLTGQLQFQLPSTTPQINLDTGTSEMQLSARLDTVHILPDQMQVTLIWRASQVFTDYKWLAGISRLHAEVA